MYRKHFQLKEKPFQLNTDPRFFWTGNSQKEVLSTLAAGLRESTGLLLLSGDFGLGKTTLLNAFLPVLPKNRIVARLPYAGVDMQAFLRCAAAGFELDGPVEDADALLAAMGGFDRRLRQNRQHALLVIDEAQFMSPEITAAVVHLLKMKRRGAIPLTVLLVGHYEAEALAKTFNGGLFRKNDQKRCQLRPLTDNETAAYIQHRLRIAGATRNLFTGSAVVDIFSFSNGIPSSINSICDFALFQGYQQGARQIDHQVVQKSVERFQIKNLPKPEAAEDGKEAAPLRLQPRPIPPLPPQTGFRRRLPVAAILFLLVVSGMLFFVIRNDERVLETATIVKDRLTQYAARLVSGEPQAIQPPANLPKSRPAKAAAAIPGTRGQRTKTPAVDKNATPAAVAETSPIPDTATESESSTGSSETMEKSKSVTGAVSAVSPVPTPVPPSQPVTGPVADEATAEAAPDTSKTAVTAAAPDEQSSPEGISDTTEPGPATAEAEPDIPDYATADVASDEMPPPETASVVTEPELDTPADALSQGSIETPEPTEAATAFKPPADETAPEPASEPVAEPSTAAVPDTPDEATAAVFPDEIPTSDSDPDITESDRETTAAPTPQESIETPEAAPVTTETASMAPEQETLPAPVSEPAAAEATFETVPDPPDSATAAIAPESSDLATDAPEPPSAPEAPDRAVAETAGDPEGVPTDLAADRAPVQPTPAEPTPLPLTSETEEADPGAIIDWLIKEKGKTTP